MPGLPDFSDAMLTESDNLRRGNRGPRRFPISGSGSGLSTDLAAVSDFNCEHEVVLVTHFGKSGNFPGMGVP
ncbi:MAG: hypothetical protein OXF56_26370 [Rhodobacteraceae bacterium]|nr:hypothetical protein [Paracoccaceae bacterium]